MTASVLFFAHDFSDFLDYSICLRVGLIGEQREKWQFYVLWVFSILFEDLNVDVSVRRNEFWMDLHDFFLKGYFQTVFKEHFWQLSNDRFLRSEINFYLSTPKMFYILCKTWFIFRLSWHDDVVWTRLNESLKEVGLSLN